MATGSEGSEPLDCEKLLEECDDEPLLVNRCLQIFSRVTQKDMDGIAEALSQNDFSQVAKLAHRIKGASATIRAEFLRGEAERLEALGREGDSAELRECFARLQAEFDNFKTFIATLPLSPD